MKKIRRSLRIEEFTGIGIAGSSPTQPPVEPRVRFWLWAEEPMPEEAVDTAGVTSA